MFGNCQFVQFLSEFKRLPNLKNVCLVELEMTRGVEVWWWKSLIQRFAKMAKGRLFHLIKCCNFG
jgi:hypothetical protein